MFASCSSMKGSCLFLCLFSMSCWLNVMLVAGNRIFHFGPCRFSMSVTEIRSGFTAIKANIQARDPIRTLSILSYPHSLHKVKRRVFGEAVRYHNFCLVPAKHRRWQTVQVREDKVMWITNVKRERCCITHHLFNFYVDKVFKHCKTEDPHINRKISSIANSFLSVKRKLGHCHEQNKCLCGQESTEKFNQILVNYEGLNVTSAAIKSLGELDILLDWMEKAP